VLIRPQLQVNWFVIGFATSSSQAILKEKISTNDFQAEADDEHHINAPVLIRFGT